MSAPLHGGDLDGIARRAGLAPDELLDFSANINPLGPPPAVRAAIRAFADGDRIARYPEPQAPILRAALARTCGVDAGSIAIGGGAAALFDAIVRAVPAQRWAVPVPAFAEYRRTLEANDRTMVPFALDARAGFALDVAAFARFAEREGCTAAIVTNPHNPSGSLASAAVLRTLVERFAGLVLDEAFIDFAEGESLGRDATLTERLIVVRSLTKFYAMPAMRVGYALAAPAAIDRIARFIPAWPVSTIAEIAAAAALGDRSYAERSLAANERERAALAAGLTTLGLRPLAAAANFLTFELPPGRPAAKVRADLLEGYRIVIRDCSSFEGMPGDRWVRIAVRDVAANARLCAALAAVLA